jgi:hypothetical protein
MSDPSTQRNPNTLFESIAYLPSAGEVTTELEGDEFFLSTKNGSGLSQANIDSDKSGIRRAHE